MALVPAREERIVVLVMEGMPREPWRWIMSRGTCLRPAGRHANKWLLEDRNVELLVRKVLGGSKISIVCQ
jgi:hypothetical protein